MRPRSIAAFELLLITAIPIGIVRIVLDWIAFTSSPAPPYHVWIFVAPLVALLGYMVVAAAWHAPLQQIHAFTLFNGLSGAMAVRPRTSYWVAGLAYASVALCIAGLVILMVGATLHWRREQKAIES